MAIVASSRTINTDDDGAAVKINTDPTDSQAGASILVANAGPNVALLGGDPDAVTFALAVSAHVSVDLAPGEAIYAATAAGESAALSLLETGV